MKIVLHSIIRYGVFVCAIHLVTCASAQAELLINGNFSQGLTGWTVTDTGSVSIVGDAAVLRESETLSEVDLYQDFTIPLGIQSLSFVLADVGTEDYFLPAGFGASLLDPSTFASLVPTVDDMTDSFYTRDLDSFATGGLAASGVTVSPAADSLPLMISLDVSALGSREVRLLFRNYGNGSEFTSSATVDDVMVGVSAVPEPSTLTLVATAALAMVGCFRLRR